MRQRLAPMFATTLLGGCSLLYNPSNLPTKTDGGSSDALVDAQIILDTNPAALELTGVYPPTLVEGTGTGGSAPAILTVHGMQMTMGATVAITAHDGTDVSSAIVVDNTNAKVSLDGYVLAVPVKVAVDMVHDAAAPGVQLDVAVTQSNGMGGMVTKMVPQTDPILTLTYLDQLTSASVSGNLIATGTHEYSQVDIDVGTMTLKPVDNAAAVVIRSRSSISITGNIDVGANDTNGPGPGGNAGGPGGAGGGLGNGSPGGAGGGAGGGLPSSAGGGFKNKGGDGDAVSTGGPVAGTDAVVSLSIAGSGGSGGRGGNLAGAAGAAGGAGGGALELTAAGNVTVVGSLASRGGKGGTGGNMPGGGGSGGLILVRGGGTVSTLALSVPSGAAGGTGAGAGSIGRTRVDSTAAPTNAPAYNGPMFSVYPSITFDKMPTVTVVGASMAPFSYFYVAEDGSVIGPITHTLGANNKASFPLGMELARGLNHVCLVVDGGTTQSPPEAMNCVDIAYLYKP